LKKANILIIDDEEKLRQLLSRIISLEGYTVFQAATAKRGFQLLEQEKDIRLAITDVKLPDETDWRYWRRSKPTIPPVK